MKIGIIGYGKLGSLIKIDESLLECITVTSASGVAFAASLMRAYQNIGILLES